MWKPLDWQHKIFGKEIMSSLSKFSKIWLFLRIIMLWSIWMERIDLVFNNIKWDIKKVQQMIWQYARHAWVAKMWIKVLGTKTCLGFITNMGREKLPLPPKQH